MANTRFENIWKILKENDFQMTNEINKDFLCTICNKILINSCITNCGCKYCSQCIVEYLDGTDKYCPGNLSDCKLELISMVKNVHFDLATNIKISKLILKCPQKGCQFQDELRNINDHTKVCNVKPLNCPFYNIGCRETEIISGQMQAHLLSENQTHSKLLMECIDFFKFEIESLKNDVCKLNEKNRDLMDEMKRDREINQKFQMSNMELQKIIELQNRKITELHANIMSQQITKRSTHNLTKFPQQITENKQSGDEKQTQNLNSIYERIAELKTKNESMATELNDLKKEKEKNEMVILELQNHEKLQGQEIEQWKHKYQSAENKYSALAIRWQQSEEMIKFIETQNSTLHNKVNEIEMNLSKQNCGEFVWNIDKFSDKSKSAQEGTNLIIYSDPFYTHKNGYKMCLRVDPNGFGSGKDTHLSVYFCIMRGIYDNILQWPFRYDVTLAIINQQTGLTHTCDTAKFDNFPNPINWNKPITERNGGIGYHQFIKLDELFTNPALCQTNQIFIKCSVKKGK